MPRTLLRTVNPFRHLTASQIDELASALTTLELAAGDALYRVGDADDRVFVVEQGKLSARSAGQGPTGHVDVIGAGQYFGDREVLFDGPRRADVSALSACRLHVLTGERFLSLVDGSPAFARALADVQRSRRKLLSAFDQFVALLTLGAADGELRMRPILEAYERLDPALHPLLHDRERIDFGALHYAVRRLPENATTTFAYFLTESMPTQWDTPERSFSAVESGVRPRSGYEVMPGKTMVLLRDSTSDLIDLVTCLCVLSVEARKLRKRFRDPSHLSALARELHGWGTRKDGPTGLPLSADELSALDRVFGGKGLERAHELVLHHEDYAIYLSQAKDEPAYAQRPAERWASQIAEATRQLVGRLPTDLDGEHEVHIISSNTHSVSNCLSPFLAKKAESIMAWARQRSHPLATVFDDERDAVYALSRHYFADRPEEARERADADRAAGLFRLRETAFTGIQVELIDTTRLIGQPIDPGIPAATRPALIVNIDFAFGQQAGEILGALILLFGRRIRSINVLGKAGALVGRRGDLLLPTTFLEQSRDMMLPVGKQAIDRERLSSRVPGRGVHEGALLTVPGTLLQNRVMLRYYLRLWRCVGLEMEGAHYAQRVHEATELGLIGAEVAQRYMYYVSDVPLDTESNLSTSLHATEGIPPLYAITRETLAGVLGPVSGR